MTRYLLDTNILIDIFSEKKSASYFDQILEDSSSILSTHIICVAEFLSGGDSRERKLLEDWLIQDDVEIIFLDHFKDAKNAAKHRNKHSLRLPDALILAGCQKTQSHLLTNDLDFLKIAKKHIHASSPFDT